MRVLCRFGVVSVLLFFVSCQTTELEKAPDHADEPNLQRTFSEEGVTKLQNSLKRRGYDVEPSGHFDDSTEEALMSFQKGEGLAETGLPDRESLERLGLNPREIYPRIESVDRDPNETPDD